MVWVERVTFIHPDGRKETAGKGQVVYSGEMPLVKVDPGKSPSWAEKGADIVAAHDDGSVEASFTIGDISMEERPSKTKRMPTRRFAVFHP